MSFEFRQATESDKSYFLGLRKSTMLEHLEREGIILSEEDHLERVNHEYGHSFIVLFNNELVGVLKYLSTVSEVELIQIQIEPQHQGKGYGSGIIQKILNDEKGKIVRLKVLKNSPAVKFYKRLGFKIVGEDNLEYHMKNEH